jgi:amidase
MQLNEMSASEIVAAIAGGRVSCVEVAQACLARIAEREDAVHAWAFVDPARVLDEARRRDSESARGPLHGLPIGIKDIIDTADMPTAMGSPIYAGHQPRADAACVAIVREAGAVILGKTVTAQFASMSPGPTVNPHNPAHTPGGSSSGSAAAVADQMVPAAFGTQTGGSVLRPSSYCGVVGYRPTFGTFNMAGIKPAAQSFDALGLHARTVDDIHLLARVLTGAAPAALEVPTAAPVVGICRTPLWEHAQPETVGALDDAAARLEAAGCRLVRIDLPDEYATLDAARVAATAYERSRAMAWEWAHRRDQIGTLLQEEILRGRAIRPDDYEAALTRLEACRAAIGVHIRGFDVVLAPAADGAAPQGIASTGNARFQGFWTALYLPAITLPTSRASNGLPVGIQLVGDYRQDEKLLAVAKWVFERLNPVGRPSDN